jgi:hypothetical protein
MYKSTRPHTLSLLDNALKLRGETSVRKASAAGVQAQPSAVAPRVTYKHSRLDRAAAVTTALSDIDRQHADLWNKTTAAATQAWSQLTGQDLLSFGDDGMRPGRSGKTR